MPASVLVGHSSASSFTGGATTGLDSTGATAIYIFGWGVFGVFEPAAGFDNLGNVWTLIGNPFSSCNGGLSGFRCFDPITGPGHFFSLVPGLDSFGTEIAVVALRAVDPTGTWALRRTNSQSGQVPIRPGLITPPVDNYVMVSAGMAGCGMAPVGVDSDFILLEALSQMGIAYQVQPVAAAINPTWTTLQPGGVPFSTGASIIEGLGVFTSGNDWRVYEA